MKLIESNLYRNDLICSIDNIKNYEVLFNSSVLVTGATGSIGSSIVDLLLVLNDIRNANITIYIAARSLAACASRFNMHQSEKLIYLPYNLLDPLLIETPVDFIIHTAGNATPNSFSASPVETIMGNLLGANTILEYAKKFRVPNTLLLSTGEVYGQGDLQLTDYTEEYSGYINSLSPRSCYPNSKRLVETLAAAYQYEFGTNSIIARPCHIYGPTFTKIDNRAHAQFLRSGVDHKDIVLYSTGAQERSYCYIIDCVSAIITILLNGNKGEAYNVANGESITTIRGFAEIVSRQSGVEVSSLGASNCQMDTPIMKQVLHAGKLELLGWKGQFSLERGIAHSLKILKGA